MEMFAGSLTSLQALDLWVQIGSSAPVTQDGAGEVEPVSMESLFTAATAIGYLSPFNHSVGSQSEKI